MPFQADDYLSRHVKTNAVDFSSRLDELIALAVPESSPNQSLYREMLSTVMHMAQADRSRWDAKIMLQTMREMERAFSRLEQFKRRRKVTVFGSARTPLEHPLYAMARELGKTLARYDLMVITGAGGGIMAAAHEGAGLDNSLGLNITLPFEQQPNATVGGTDNLLSFHFFFVRKLFFIKEADALILCPGGFGTLDEALEVLTLIQTGKSPLVPIVLLDEPGGSYWQDALKFMQHQLVENRYILPTDMRLIRLANNVEDATLEIADFYRNFHSSRWIERNFVIRMNHQLAPRALEQLNEHFADLCLHDGFEQRTCEAAEMDEPELECMPRLSFAFNGRDHGRLRELTDYINQPQNWA
ncbi:TIGR00730 family Rossman fold protein [Stutzerimonas kirkiae]|uniref:AMP nucleosidase n=1 Tax=Stutzerimonas kirkiae TaxID=2211392 RepID=A0A4Q9RAZ6_9GAMM|nr:TIGR00730 family Rossman fold protein [Stutzerimonas kirkiae]TBU97969.1 TIGR00730 family Rossman fold protein [Stutzerimonas kirkiae]TBV04515.1 TIGR00730 family Rossman fold protein [Stutzerimonas kirkiae]TBV11551.1 TIGR00730 family Rossman fold protein [Stutzerimonas kirkiae]TBV16147.1 TIGR00730 family Rossman fold protein [Stutzerimonas kirkiae]